MRKIIYIFLLILMTSSFLSCDSEEKLPIFGEYTFNKMLYLSALSSASKEYSEELNKNTRYIINKDNFQVVSDSDTYEIKNPNYETLKMNEEQIKAFNESVFNGFSLEDYKYKYQYDIYDSKGNKSNYRVYLMDDEVWLATYMTATTEKEYIFDICSLK